MRVDCNDKSPALEFLVEVADEPGQPTRSNPNSPLHEAMNVVLRGFPESWRSALVRSIGGEHPRMRDGRPATARQIHARLGHYPHIISKSGTSISSLGRWRHLAALTATRATSRACVCGGGTELVKDRG